MPATKHNIPKMPPVALVADSISAMLAYWDKDLVCRYANNALLQWFGKDADEMIDAMTLPALMGAQYGASEVYVKGVLAGNAQHFRRDLFLAREMAPRSVQVSYFPHIEKGKLRGFIAHSVDVTAEKTLEKQLEDSSEIINAQNRSLLNFANIVSHNLRSYAANFENVLGMYEVETETASKEQLWEFLKELSKDFRSSIDGLSKVANAQNLGRVPLRPVDLHSYVAKAVGVLRMQIMESGATIHNTVPDGILIDGNPAYIESIILNFMSNAIKYRHPDRPPVVEVSTLVVGHETVFSIKDNGVGIDLDRHRHSLFGMYKTFHGNADATGIGLFITKYQIDSMGAHIGVESEVGKGSWFRVYFRTSAAN